MTKTVNIHYAKTHLSRLLEEVRRGEELVIARAGKPVAKVVAVEPTLRRRVPGLGRGQFLIRDDFNDPLPDDLLAEFDKPGL